MGEGRPIYYQDPAAVVEETLRRVGRRVVLGTPLGLGKANHLVNELYRRAAADPSIELTLFTALSLARPRAANELQRRLLEPIVERVFGDYPELAYVEPMRRSELPDNIRVREFYFQPGAYLASPQAQQSYVSSNYTHVVRDLLDAGINVLAQMVAAEPAAPEAPADTDRFSLSSNPDLTLDLLPALERRRRAGTPIALLAQVNRRLPFFYGDAELAPDAFDLVLDHPRYEHTLFGPPDLPVSTADYAIGLAAGTLVRDGGTLQLGIGALGDAVVHGLVLRQQDNEAYRRALDDLRLSPGAGSPAAALGSLEPFERGLYGATEMLVDGFLELYSAGILKRRVYPDAALQRLLDDGRIGEEVATTTLDALAEAGEIGDPLSAADVDRLARLGILPAGTRLERPAHLADVAPEDRRSPEDGRLVLPDGRRLPADLAGARRAVVAGGRLAGGRLVHACFFLGPQGFYQRLRELPRAERELIEMTAISHVNQLYGDEELKRAQRRHARFLNTAMMVTLGGAAVSDGLEDGRVVSGVGGQYNFVAMAHALEEGRSAIMVRSTRTDGDGEVSSNLVWSYGHATIPRHLRDLVVTEYGIADLRGKTDSAVATALIEIADSRFQGELLDRARAAGKVGGDYRLPDRCRENTPERLEAALAPHRAAGRFPEFPFGTDLTAEEVVLRRALSRFKEKLDDDKLALVPSLDELGKLLGTPEAARPYLERMALDAPSGPRERLLQKLVLFALIEEGAV